MAEQTQSFAICKDRHKSRKEKIPKAKNISRVNTQSNLNVNHSPMPMLTRVRNARQINQRVKPKTTYIINLYIQIITSAISNVKSLK